MHTSDDLVSIAFDYLAGRAAFPELYAMALELEPALPPGDLPSRLAGEVILAEAEEHSASRTREDTRRRIADLLKAEALRGMRVAS
jgi:hypothetical protein